MSTQRRGGLVRRQPCVRSSGSAPRGCVCWEEEVGGGQPTCQAAQGAGASTCAAEGLGTRAHGEPENREAYEMQMVGSAWSIQDIRADASRMSEAGGDGYGPSTRSQGNLGCQQCSGRDGARDIVNSCGLGLEQWRLFTQDNMVQNVQGLCGGQFHRQQTRVC